MMIDIKQSKNKAYKKDLKVKPSSHSYFWMVKLWKILFLPFIFYISQIFLLDTSYFYSKKSY